MTVSTSYVPLSYSGNGSTTSFAITWPFFAASDIVVILVDDAGVETIKTMTTHYAVSGGTTVDGLPSTGSVTMVTAPASGETLRIHRVTNKVQSSTWTNNGSFQAKSIEATADRLMIIAQELGVGGGSGGGGGGSVLTGDALLFDSSGADPNFFDARNEIIRYVADPVDGTDAANKLYVDQYIDDVLAAAAAASASESSAATSAGNASTSATSAASSASSASMSASAASAARIAAEAAYDAFDDRYLGAKGSDPLIDNDGDALLDGAIYWSTTLNQLRVYDAGNSQWTNILDGNYRGHHLNLAALQAAHPTATAGAWAILLKGSGTSASMAVWDSDNTTPAWVDTGVPPSTVDWGNVTNKPSGFAATATTVTDCNSAITNGWYQFAPGAANSPQPVSGIDQLGAMNVHASSGTYVKQTVYYIAFGNANDSYRYVRWMIAGTWSAWTKCVETRAEADARYALLSGSNLTGRLATIASVIADWNNAVTNGYFMGQTTTNNPLGSDTRWWLGYVVNHGSAGYCRQIVWDFVNSRNVYSRSQIGGAFQAWVQIGGVDGVCWHNDNKASASDYRVGTATKGIDVATAWSAAGLVTLADAATISVDMSTFINATVTLAGNRTLASPTNEKVGQSGVIYIVQDATGSRTLAYGSEWKFAGGTAPVLSTAANAVDALYYTVRASGFVAANLVKDIK